MYYAHYCNELATQISISSGWKYNMKSLTYYQHASIKPNDTGGYVDIEEKTYNEIVSAKHEQAKSIALLFYIRNVQQVRIDIFWNYIPCHRIHSNRCPIYISFLLKDFIICCTG